MSGISFFDLLGGFSPLSPRINWPPEGYGDYGGGYSPIRIEPLSGEAMPAALGQPPVVQGAGSGPDGMMTAEEYKRSRAAEPPVPRSLAPDLYRPVDLRSTLPDPAAPAPSAPPAPPVQPGVTVSGGRLYNGTVRPEHDMGPAPPGMPDTPPMAQPALPGAAKPAVPGVLQAKPGGIFGGLFGGMLGGGGMTGPDGKELTNDQLMNRLLRMQLQKAMSPNWGAMAAAFAEAGKPSLLPTGGMGAALGKAAGAMNSGGGDPKDVVGLLEHMEKLKTTQAKNALIAGAPADIQRIKDAQAAARGGGGGASPVPAPDVGGGMRASGVLTGGDPRNKIPVITAAFEKYGHDPSIGIQVARSEGLGTFLGDKGKSGGAFQLYTGGGLGNTFQQETGLDPLDAKNEDATIEWVAKNLDKYGWKPWHGAAKIGITGYQGIGSGARTAAAGPPGGGSGGGAAPAGAYAPPGAGGDGGAAPALPPGAGGDGGAAPALPPGAGGGGGGFNYDALSMLYAELESKYGAYGAEAIIKPYIDQFRHDPRYLGAVAGAQTAAQQQATYPYKREEQRYGSELDTAREAARLKIEAENKRQEQERGARLEPTPRDQWQWEMDPATGQPVQRPTTRYGFAERYGGYGAPAAGPAAPAAPPPAALPAAPSVAAPAAPGGGGMGVGGALPMARPMAPTAAPASPAAPAAGPAIIPPPPQTEKDYRPVWRPEKRAWEVEPIPGTSAYKAEQEKDVQRLRSADEMLQKIDLVASMSSPMTVGIMAHPLLAQPNTPAGDMATQVRSINGAALVSMINQMRASNPTGGAMGQMSTQESQMMVDAATALQQTNSKPAFDRALADLRRKYVDMAYGTPEQLKGFLQDGKISRTTYDAITDVRARTQVAAPGSAAGGGAKVQPGEQVYGNPSDPNDKRKFVIRNGRAVQVE